jgi:hypothetical protein
MGNLQKNLLDELVIFYKFPTVIGFFYASNPVYEPSLLKRKQQTFSISPLTQFQP